MLYAVGRVIPCLGPMLATKMSIESSKGTLWDQCLGIKTMPSTAPTSSHFTQFRSTRLGMRVTASSWIRIAQSTMRNATVCSWSGWRRRGWRRWRRYIRNGWRRRGWRRCRNITHAYSCARAYCTGRLLKSDTATTGLTSKGSLKSCLKEKPAGGRDPERSRAHTGIPL